jgi:hypothetical protein
MGEVGVHIGEAGHEEFAAAVDDLGAARGREVGGGADGRDAAVPHEDGVVGEDALKVEGDDGDVDEGDGVGGRRGKLRSRGFWFC